VAIRPILVRPLMQSFAVIIKPTETEINKVWTAQVLQPFETSLAPKFPFTPESNSEATNAEIGLVFGPQGTIAKFFDTTIGPLVVRRGDELSARTWANMGVNLAPQVVTSFPGWIAPLSESGVSNTVATTAAESQTLFELQALGASGATEFTVEIDGQSLRWRGQPQPFVSMVWPNPQGVPGSRITAITPQGTTVVLLNEPGHFGLKKMVEAAKRTKKDNGIFELSWSNSGVTVTANLKITGTQKRAAPVAAPAGGQNFKRLKLPATIIAAAPAAVPETMPAVQGAAQ
jgi:type VI secretion system protein ImpL